MRNKRKSKELGLHQTKGFLHGAGNDKKTKRQHTEWEKIFANDASDQGLISNIFKELIQFNTQTRTRTIL